MTKKDAIIRDVAKLLKKYRLADLDNVVSSLKKHTKLKNSRVGATPRRAKTAGIQKSKQQTKAKPVARTRSRSPVSTKSRKRNQAPGTRKRLRARSHAAKGPDIQRVFEKLAGKGGLSEKRKDAANEPVAQSKQDAHRSLARVLKAASIKDRGEDYARWFRIISGDAGDTKLDDLAAGSTSTQVDESKQWKEAIANLRMRDFLLGSSFRLHSPSPSVSRTIIFLPDGGIGTGRTQFEAGWRLSEGRLELLDEAGTVQSRFVLSSDGRFLTQTEPSTRTQQLVRVASKK